MQHYVAGNHFLNQEASAMALNHHYELCQPGCVCPEFENYVIALEKYPNSAYC